MLSGSILGDLGQLIKEGRNEVAVQRAKYWKNQFGDRYFIELTRTGRPGEDVYVAQATRIAAELGIPVVATNQVLFSEKEDFEAHLARMAIARKQSIEKVRADSLYTVSPHQYLKTPEQMAELFADIPVAIEKPMRWRSGQSWCLSLVETTYHYSPAVMVSPKLNFCVAKRRRGLKLDCKSYLVKAGANICLNTKSA